MRYNGRDSRLRPYECIYNRLLDGAHKRNINIELSYEDFLGFTEIEECHYCAASVLWTKFNTHGPGGARTNLDRKDNNIGYTNNNCVVCCYRCNSAKLDHFTYEEWLKVGEVIKTFKV